MVVRTGMVVLTGKVVRAGRERLTARLAVFLDGGDGDGGEGAVGGELAADDGQQAVQGAGEAAAVGVSYQLATHTGREYWPSPKQRAVRKDTSQSSAVLMQIRELSMPATLETTSSPSGEVRAT